MAHHNPDSLYGADSTILADDMAFWSAPFGRRLLDIVRHKKSQMVLDLGCGFGFPIIELSMRLGQSSTLFGLDPWKPAVLKAAHIVESHNLANVQLVEGCAEEMPFEDGSFDLVVSNNGVNNVNDLKRTFAEIHRVSKPGAQFAFTFNTDRTFESFYIVFREVLTDFNLHESLVKLGEQVYSKRKPLVEYISLLESNGFKLMSMQKDSFSYHFSDGTAMLSHSFIKTAFMPSWLDVVPQGLHKSVFDRIEEKLNHMGEASGRLSMEVPFLIIDSERL